MLLICYDISDRRRRAKVHKTLKSYGENIQESVFEAFLDDRQQRLLHEQLSTLLQPPDKIRYYLLCRECQKKVSGSRGHPCAAQHKCLVI